MTPTNDQKHQAGRHLVAGQALLRGYPAATTGRSSYVDINGKRAQVQVAAQGAWQIADIDHYLSGTVERVVLVDLREPSAPEFYVATGAEVRALVQRRHTEFMTRVGGRRPRNPDSRHSAIDPADVQAWKDNWSLFERPDGDRAR
jgi:hypothetical protein